MANDKTEKATPKKRDDARKKGQVARSVDLNGAVILMAALLVLPSVGPAIYTNSALAMTRALGLITNPEVVSERGLGAVLEGVAAPAALSVLPLGFACMVAAVLVNVVQVGFKPSGTGLKPDPKKLNPLTGFKNLFGKRAVFETGKSLIKVLAVGSIAVVAILPKLDEFAGLVGLPPVALAPALAREVLSVLQRAGAAYLVIALIDLGYQKWRHEKDLRMDLQEVKDEVKQQGVPNEVRSAMRRRQMAAAGKRMMEAVPTADVVVTNPTHYAVALRYEPGKDAPEVVAKGMDHVAKLIREAAREAGVPIVPDPPLARSLHASVEVGDVIPEELYQAVAHVLAFVYRMAGKAA